MVRYRRPLSRTRLALSVNFFWLSVSPMWVGDQANWLSSNNTRGKNLRMKKLNLICLIFRYQTTYHKVGVKLQHSFAELWGRFEEFLAIFFTFFPKFFGKFWSAGSSRKPIQKTSLVPLVYDPISRINILFTNIQKILVSRKNYHL